MKNIALGLIGFGTVGTGVAKILAQNGALLQRRLGARLVLKTIADLDVTTDRGVPVADKVLTRDAGRVLDDPDIAIVIELMGGIEPARTFVLKAIERGKHVVTANKALLAKHGPEIYRAACDRGVDVAFEASVGGGIPIIRAVRESFASDRIVGIFGILNGTANYILSNMTAGGGDFKDILKEAQARGYAEADPSFDVEGIDTQHKLAVLMGLAYGRQVNAEAMYTEGISKITPLDIEFARELGYTIKLLAICRGAGPDVDARVHPTLIHESHLLSRVGGSFNAVFIQSRDVGATMFYGQGAGMMPTGSAVVADTLDLARNVIKGVSNRVGCLTSRRDRMTQVRVKPVNDIQTRYYLRFAAGDKPGVLSKISGILGRHDISIHSVVQKGRRSRGGAVPIFMLTHEAREQSIQKALKEIDRLALLRHKTMLIRIEGALLEAP